MNHHLKIFLCKVFTNKKLTSKLILFIQKPDFITLYQCRITVLKSLEGRRKHKRMISVYYACKICSRLCVAYIIAGTGHTFTSENRIQRGFFSFMHCMHSNDSIQNKTFSQSTGHLHSLSKSQSDETACTPNIKSCTHTLNVGTF